MDASALRSRLVNAEGARKQHEVGYSGPQNRQILIQRAKSWNSWKKINHGNIKRIAPVLFPASALWTYVATAEDGKKMHKVHAAVLARGR